MSAPTIPTRQRILSDFRYWVEQGSDSTFQFERVTRRWIACGYSVEELPLLLTVTREQVLAAVAKATK